jgi:glycosyltransferase
MTISIITATYNSATTLADTLDSLHAQAYQDTELLIQDGGSTDETASIVSRYPKCHWKQEKDSGLYNAMNRGVQRATGDVVGILNSDDFYADEYVLEEVAAAFAADPKLDALYGDLLYVHPEKTEKIIRHWQAGKASLRKWRMGWMPPHPTFFVRRDVYNRLGGFNETLKFAADYELMLRFCYKASIKVGYLPRVLVHMRAGGISNSSFGNRLAANAEDRRAWLMNGLKCPPALQLFKPMRKLIQWL